MRMTRLRVRSSSAYVASPSVMHVVAPPVNLTLATNNGHTTLAWSAAPESALLGYAIYRSVGPAGPFTRLK